MERNKESKALTFPTCSGRLVTLLVAVNPDLNVKNGQRSSNLNTYLKTHGI
jgi:hypothetical protein